MTFSIISCGWQCADFLEWTLQSVLDQENQDWKIMIVDDASTDPRQATLIRDWCEKRRAAGDKRWRYRINEENLGTPRNQYEGITELKPGPEDIIIFLDLDGDKLAHPKVLDNLLGYYADGTLVTYGSYLPVPDLGTSTPAKPFPHEIVRRRQYRKAILRGHTGFNHLRTMKAKIFYAIPESQFRWDNGQWYKHGSDYILMAAALELANGRYKCLEEVLLIYNHANPNADYLTKSSESSACTVDFLRKPALEPLKEYNMHKEPFLSLQERRNVLREYGLKYGLNVFIETGTNQGDTPWALRDIFKELYTIELDRKLYRAARDRFVGTNIEVIAGDSTYRLPTILKSISEPALVWLDGHHSGRGTAHGELSTPIVQELEILFADDKKHVILIDDARIFEGQPEHYDEEHYADYPSCEWVKEQAENHGYTYELKDDIIRLLPA